MTAASSFLSLHPCGELRHKQSLEQANDKKPTSVSEHEGKISQTKITFSCHLIFFLVFLLNMSC